MSKTENRPLEGVTLENFVSLKELHPNEWKTLLELSREVKSRPQHFRQRLVDKSIVLVFEKPSLRTRLTFELGVKQLGGEAVHLDYQQAEFGDRESLFDVAKNLERWCNAIVARTFSHQKIVTLAQHAKIPVINALTDEEHPCQALADLFTLQEKWEQLTGRVLAFVGDGNNVCTSLIQATALSGMSMIVITPPSHRPYPGAELDFSRLSRRATSFYRWSESLKDLAGADAVYTDTWVSMGQEKDAADRLRALRPYQVTPKIMVLTRKDSYFMHCLPAHRNQEVTDTVIDSPSSLVFEQAENRLHVQKALMLFLMTPQETENDLHLNGWATRVD